MREYGAYSMSSGDGDGSGNWLDRLEDAEFSESDERIDAGLLKPPISGSDVPELCRLLHGDERGAIRRSAAEALGSLADATTEYSTRLVDGLTRAIRADDDPEVRAEAIDALYRHDPAEVERLVKTMRTAIERNDNTDATAFFRRWLAADQPGFRLVAAIALGTGEEEVISDLKSAFTDTDRRVQARAIEAYARVGSAVDAEPLERPLRSDDPMVRRAAAEALGSLPVKLRGPAPPDEAAAVPVDCRWEKLLARAGAPFEQTPDNKGRNLVLPVADGRLLVVKTAGGACAVAELAAEIGWMTYLSDKMENDPGADCRFAVPQPVTEQVLRLKGLPVVPPGVEASSECYAAAFIAPGNYFNYPNESIDHRLPSQSELKAILIRNARLLGHLTAKGIVHTAPIPLFHNRVQRERRTDNGLYEWHRAGRLDRWLASCRYPNIGASGIRDFEHFISFASPPRRLYQHIGAHILSLVLVAGSYFRYQDPGQIGLQTDGRPVDVRHRFDRGFFKEVMEAVFLNYYEGFAGKAFDGVFPLDINDLVDRLIDAFGVDRHMTETLRAADQQEMSRAEFEAFLADRGFEKRRISETEQAAAEIVIETGPHLGDFNDRISVPALIEFTAAASAMCIAGRYFSERF